MHKSLKGRPTAGSHMSGEGGGAGERMHKSLKKENLTLAIWFAIHRVGSLHWKRKDKYCTILNVALQKCQCLTCKAVTIFSVSTVHVIIKLEKSHQGNLRGTVDKLHYSLLVRTALIHKVCNDILSKPLKSGTVSRLIWNLALQVQFRNIALQVDCFETKFHEMMKMVTSNSSLL